MCDFPDPTAALKQDACVARVVDNASRLQPSAASLSVPSGQDMPDRPQTITFAELREIVVRGILVYCADYRCSHSIAISGDRWTDEVRLSDVEARFICSAYGTRGADVQPDFNWKKDPVAMVGYR
jgi:hypothetical protein